MGIYNRSIRRKMGLAAIAGMIMCLSSTGQTVGNGEGQTLSRKSYDTVIAAQGFGAYPLTFPQWDPVYGRLVAVAFRTHVTVGYGFTLRNVLDSLPETYIVTLGRQDSITGAAIRTISDSAVKDTIGTFTLDPGKWHWQDASTLMEHNYRDSITDNLHLEAFTGTGKLPFTWSPVTWSNVYGDNSAGYHYDAAIRDTAHISLTYYYAAAAPPNSLANTAASPVTGHDLALYPNPATDYILLAFDPAATGDWQVDILAADGQLIQRNSFSAVSQARVNFARKLPAGVYFAAATELRTLQTYKKTFVIR